MILMADFIRYTLPVSQIKRVQFITYCAWISNPSSLRRSASSYRLLVLLLDYSQPQHSTGDWGTGFCSNISIKNTDATSATWSTLFRSRVQISPISGMVHSQKQVMAMRLLPKPGIRASQEMQPSISDTARMEQDVLVQLRSVDSLAQ